MDEPSETAAARSTFKDWPWLLALLAVVIPLRGWLLWNTEVPARDCIGHIRYALQFEEKPWGEVLRSFHQHPGYAFTIWLTSIPVRSVAGETSPEVMVFAAQLVSACCAILLVWPMFYLGKAIWSARTGFGGALLFQCLPVSGHHLSDGVSEPLFVLWVAAALLFGIWGTNGRSLSYLALSGLCGGLAYLTRPEGLLTIAAVGLVLFGMQFRPAWRRPWTAWLGATACFLSPALLVGSLYVAATGSISIKPSVTQVMGVVAELPHLDLPATRSATLQANLFAASFKPVDGSGQRLLLSLHALGAELLNALSYLGVVLALLPLLVDRRAPWQNPGASIVFGYFWLQTGVLIALALAVSYVSDRHALPVVMVLCYLAALGMDQVARLVLRAPVGSVVVGRASVVALLVLVAATCLPRTVQRLHGNRAGNHAAGLWIAPRLVAGDMVDDDHSWSHFYAGQVFVEHKDPPAEPGYRPMCYVVRTRSRDPEIAAVRQAEERVLQRRGELVYHWPEEKSAEAARVVVYALPRDPRRFPWQVVSRQKMTN